MDKFHDHTPTLNEMIAGWMNEEWNPVDGPFYSSDVLAAARVLDKMQIMYPQSKIVVFESSLLYEDYCEVWKSEGNNHRLLSMVPSLPLAICNAWLSVR